MITHEYNYDVSPQFIYNNNTKKVLLFVKFFPIINIYIYYKQMILLHILIYNVASLYFECYLLHKNNLHASGCDKRQAILNLLYMIKEHNYIINEIMNDDKNLYSYDEIEYADMEKCWSKLHYTYTKETVYLLLLI